MSQQTVRFVVATIRKRLGKWQVQIRRNGFQPVSRSFLQRSDAERWARQSELELDRCGLMADVRDLKGIKLKDLLDRYLRTITPSKRSAPIERCRIGVILRHDVAEMEVLRLTAAHFASYRDDRLKNVTGETVRKDLKLLNHLFAIAKRDWGLKLPGNPLAEVTKPPPSRPRTRRLDSAEAQRLFLALSKTQNDLLGPMIRFALETGMRRGEILRMRWSHIDHEKRLLRVPETKNGFERTVPLSTAACAVLKELKGCASERVFPTTATAIRQAWVRLTRRAGLVDLHFHDLRHEAISRIFEKGLNVPQVALISGHRDPRMLFRYTHLRPEDLVEKLG